MQRLIFTTIDEGKIKLIMLKDITDGLPFTCIYYNGRQPLLAIQAIKAQSCKTTDARIDKNDHMFSNTHRKIQRRKQLASKVIQMCKKVVPRAIEFTTKSDFAVQSCNYRRRKHYNNINILSRTNVVQLSKAIESCAQKAKILFAAAVVVVVVCV